VYKSTRQSVKYGPRHALIGIVQLSFFQGWRWSEPEP